MRSTVVAGGLSAIVFGVAGLVWTALELVPQTLGFHDTDDPAVSLAYLRDNPEVYAQAGVALFVMAMALTVLVFVTWDALVGRSGSLGLRTASAMGLLGAICLFLFGVLRLGIYPLLHIDGLSQDWGEATYLVMRTAGIHGFAQGALVVLCAWAICVAILGVRAGVVPRWLALLAVLPGIRLAAVLGPVGGFNEMPGEVWVVTMLSIPGTMVWFVLLGLTMLWQARKATAAAAGTASLEPAAT